MTIFQVLRCFFLLLSLSALVGCGKQTVRTDGGENDVRNAGESNEKKVVADQVVRFPLDRNTLNVSSCLLPLRLAGRRLLTHYNQNLNAVDFYDMQSKKLVQRTVLQKEGPDGVGDLAGFLVVDYDSIWVLFAQPQVSVCG